MIISHNGASGDYPGATDLAYEKAIEDGADIIDCSVQMSSDGVAFCSDRADLMKTTTAATLFMDRSTNVAEIQSTDGIFSFDLTWSEIQSIRRKLHIHFSTYILIMGQYGSFFASDFSTNREFLRRRSCSEPCNQEQWQVCDTC